MTPYFLSKKPQLFYNQTNSIGLFGSIVSADFKPESDIDIMVDFSQPIGVEFIDLAEELEKLLDRKVDLVSKAGIRPFLILLSMSSVIPKNEAVYLNTFLFASRWPISILYTFSQAFPCTPNPMPENIVSPSPGIWLRIFPDFVFYRSGTFF